MKSGLNPAWSIDKVGWEIYIAVVSSDRRRLRALRWSVAQIGGWGV